jgi:predicted ATPase
MERALARAKRIEEGRCFAELLRKNGELLLVRAAPTDVANTEECFRQALEWGRRQDALSWELRSATSLARLYHRQGRTPPGAQGVGPRLPAVHRARREVFRVGALEDSVDVAGGATSPPA